jgi:hypothetical protein
MRQFLSQSFLCSLILLLFASCKSYQLTDINPISSSEKTVENLYFSSNEDYVYKCRMEVYNNDISGILIIKKISENDFKLNYVLADLDKKMVINFLKNDFQELLRKKYPVTESFENERFKIYSSEVGKNKHYLFFNKENGLLNQIVYTKNKREKIDFSFEAKKHTFAEVINLQHKDFKINIRLNQITEND